MIYRGARGNAYSGCPAHTLPTARASGSGGGRGGGSNKGLLLLLLRRQELPLLLPHRTAPDPAQVRPRPAGERDPPPVEVQAHADAFRAERGEGIGLVVARLRRTVGTVRDQSANHVLDRPAPLSAVRTPLATYPSPHTGTRNSLCVCGACQPLCACGVRVCTCSASTTSPSFTSPTSCESGSNIAVIAVGRTCIASRARVSTASCLLRDLGLTSTPAHAFVTGVSTGTVRGTVKRGAVAHRAEEHRRAEHRGWAGWGLLVASLISQQPAAGPHAQEHRPVPVITLR